MVTINTKLKNVTDGTPDGINYDISGVPGTRTTLFTDRTFTLKDSNIYEFTTIPKVEFIRTETPSNYNVIYTYVYTSGSNTSNTIDTTRKIKQVKITIHYNIPNLIASNDIIEISALAKANKLGIKQKRKELDGIGFTNIGNNIYRVAIDTSEIKNFGSTRLLRIFGDPNSILNLKLTSNKKSVVVTDGLGTATNDVVVLSERTVKIPEDGSLEYTLRFPKNEFTTIKCYKLELIENTASIFGNGVDRIIEFNQYPMHETRLILSETDDTTWTLPATTTIKYFGDTKLQSNKHAFAFTVTHSNDIGYSVTDTTNTAFTGTTMLCDTNHNASTKNIRVGDIISGTNIVAGTTITAVNVDANLKKYTISEAPSASVPDETTITFTRPSFTSDSFTQARTGTTVTNPKSLDNYPEIDSLIEYTDLTTTIDNNASPNEVLIRGIIQITPGYDIGGRTEVTLNINDILNHI